MWTARRQFVVGVLLGLTASAAWFGFHFTVLSFVLICVSIKLVTHAPCIGSSGEHGKTCLLTGDESRSQRAPEGLITPDAVASALITGLIMCAATPAWNWINTDFPSVAEAVTSHWFKEATMSAVACDFAFLWIVCVLTAAGTLQALRPSQQS
jgi:hypothetical protein